MTRVPDGFTAEVEWLTAEYEPPLQIAVRSWIVQQIKDESHFAEPWLRSSDAGLQALLAVQDALTAVGGWKPADYSARICMPW